MTLFTIFSFLLGGWVAGSGSGSGSGLFLGDDSDCAGKGICSAGWGRMMGSANGGGKDMDCPASGGCTMMGSNAAIVCESVVMF